MLESLLACYLSPLILVVLVHLAVLGFVKVTFLGILSSDLHVLLQLEVLVEQLHEVHLRHVVEEVDDELGHHLVKLYLRELAEPDLLAEVRVVLFAADGQDELVLVFLVFQDLVDREVVPEDLLRFNILQLVLFHLRVRVVRIHHLHLVLLEVVQKLVENDLHLCLILLSLSFLLWLIFLLDLSW